MKSKKGAEMTIGTIVIIVLALIVLVVLVLGFTGGWGNLWGRITSFFGGANVDSVVQACQMACTTKSKNDYCTRERDVRFEDKLRNGKYNCIAIEKEDVGLEECSEYSACTPVKKTTKCTDTQGYAVCTGTGSGGGQCPTDKVDSGSFLDVDTSAGKVCCKDSCV